MNRLAGTELGTGPWKLRGEKATIRFGVKLGGILKPGTTLALQGDLGAGKTTLVRGIVEGLGGDPRQVSSPSYSLVHQYATPGARVYHLDGWRLKSGDDLAFTEIPDLAHHDAIVLLEWPERMGIATGSFPLVRIDRTEPKSRTLSLVWP